MFYSFYSNSYFVEFTGKMVSLTFFLRFDNNHQKYYSLVHFFISDL